jgi:predicted dehydrogenase
MDRKRPPQSALVVGAGSIGRRHLGNLKQLGVPKLSACDPNPDRLAYVLEHFQAESFPDIETGLRAEPDIVLICSPPVYHATQTLQAIRAGTDVFVEKPVAHSAEGLEELLAEERKSGRVVQVGYNLRFHPPVEKLKELVASEAVGKILWGRVEAGSYLPDWRPWQDYRKSYTSSREMGGGIILDGSHELDYATWLFGAPIELACMAGKVSGLEISVEDCATVLLRFPNGSQLDVHVDFMERFYSRGCVLSGERGKLQWDFTGNALQIHGVGEKMQTISFDCEVNHMYVAELRHFLDCVENGRRPKVTLQDAILTLRVALAARTSAEERRWINLG